MLITICKLHVVLYVPQISIIVPNLNSAVTQADFNSLIILDVVVSLTENDNRSVQSAEQDQTALMFSMILIYSLRKINLCSRTAG